jgi:hypothetical protein
VPAAYVAAALPRSEISVRASTTTLLDVPVRAIRSISGRVVFRGPAGQALPGAGPLPLKGVQVEVEGRTAVTDDEGRFVIRDLPAGDLQVHLVPTRTLPSDLRAPSGSVRMPKEPLQIDNAVIAIENPRLVEYVVPANAAAPGRQPR